MEDLSFLQLAIIGAIFVWSGFVRSGLGFGGTALSLPLLLLVANQPLLFLPSMAVHLLVFSLWITYGSPLWRALRSGQRRHWQSKSIDWAYLRQSMQWLLVPKLLGVVGLLTMSPEWLSGMIFAIILIYGLSYVTDRPFRSQSVWLDRVFLALGGYASGTSLTGAPLIVAVYSQHVSRAQLRDTLFVLWFILVLIKLLSFVAVGVDMQLRHQLWLLPCATLGHLLGMRAYAFLQEGDSRLFYRVVGAVLVGISTIGLLRLLA